MNSGRLELERWFHGRRSRGGQRDLEYGSGNGRCAHYFGAVPSVHSLEHSNMIVALNPSGCVQITERLIHGTAADHQTV
eukprot:COSAG06_NODE_42520_length_381_cov_0.514184_1_plen_79_part_00